MSVTSSQFLIDGKSFVTKTDENSATVIRTPTGAARDGRGSAACGGVRRSSQRELSTGVGRLPPNPRRGRRRRGRQPRPAHRFCIPARSFEGQALANPVETEGSLP